ncbi:hypothetical protein [Aestuariimicrobium kwangyangense]|uniref:hypothetical protein n=1 Tax=Aestuariimicrobium kwangyangense TaxID=396389 RepID=UPI0003B70A23|nr:hypothetical protein [Aestuariimicrobium kwangyangense]
MTPRNRWTILAVVGVVVIVLVSAAILRVTGSSRAPGPTPTSPSGRGATPRPQSSSTTDLGQLGDFEAGNPIPLGWQVNAPRGVTVETSSTRAVTGKRSLYVADETPSAGATVMGPALTMVGGAVTYLRGRAFITQGQQDMSLVFYDRLGKELGRVSGSAVPSAGRWSTVTLRGVAPEGVAVAQVVISTADKGLSQGWWDALASLEPALRNGGFEDAPSRTEPVPGWTDASNAAGSARVVTDDPRTGRRALELLAAEPADTARVTSSLTPVFGGGATRLRMWVRQGTRALEVTVDWFASDGTPAGTEHVDLTSPGTQWRLASRDLNAPTLASTARVTFTAWGPSSVTLDGVTLLPIVDGLSLPGEGGIVGDPLDDFSNVVQTTLTTVDGRLKACAIVSGYPAHFQVVDVVTGDLEADLPFDNPNFSQSGAIAVADDGSVYTGSQGGHVYHWDPVTNTLQDLGRATATATAVFDLTPGPDGRIWGGTYPGGELISIDPTSHLVSNHGQVAPGRDYARAIAVDESYVYVGVGSSTPAIVRIQADDTTKRTTIPLPVPVTTGTVSELSVYGNFLATNVPTGKTPDGTSHPGQRYLYDLTRKTWDVAANVPGQAPVGEDSKGRFFYLRGGSLVGVDSSSGRASTIARHIKVDPWQGRTIHQGVMAGLDGEWMVLFQPASGLQAVNLANGKVVTVNFSFRPVSLRMKSLAVGPEGSLYVGGYGGASLAVVDPATGEASQYPLDRTARGVIGEVEGMISQGRYQFLGTYTRGKIFRYDTTQPWVDGSNPTLVADLSGDLQDRPQAWATSGGRTYFGTVPAYGHRGGVLGVIETPTSAPRVIEQPVPGQSVVSLAASGDIAYGGTSRWGGLGATPIKGDARVFAYDTRSGRLLWSVAPVSGAQSFGGMVLTHDGQLWAATGGTLVRLDPTTGRVMKTVVAAKLSQPERVAWRNVDLKEAEGRLYLAAGGSIHRVDLASGAVTTPVPSGVTHQLLAVVDGEVYFPTGASLRRVPVS